MSLKGGKTAVGPVTTSDGKLEIATKTSGTVEASKDDVTPIRNDAEQTAYDKSLHPGSHARMDGGANVGFSVARGNSETENLALAINAVHPTLNDKITVYLSSIDTQNNLATPSTVANLIQGGLRYDRNINPKLFAFAAGDFMSNALQFLDLRQVYTGGLGYHAIKSDATVLDFLGGVNYTHETYSNGTLLKPVLRRFIFLWHYQPFRRSHSRRRTQSRTRQKHRPDAEPRFLPGSAAIRPVSRNFQPRHGHEDQQVVRMAKSVRRHLCLQPAERIQEERPYLHDWPKLFLYALERG